MAEKRRRNYNNSETSKVKEEENKKAEKAEKKVNKNVVEKTQEPKEEEQDVEEETIERFRKAILNSTKSIKKRNEAVKTVVREWSEFILGGIAVVVLAVLIWFGIHHFTEKKEISQITGEVLEEKDLKDGTEPSSIQAYKTAVNSDPVTKVDLSSTATAVEYKEELATLQALTVTEASVTVPTASTGAKVLGKYYVLQLSTYRDSNKAKKDVEYMKTKGFEAYYMQEGKRMYRVILNIIFTTMEDAESFGENMKKKNYIQGFNVKVMENKIEEETDSVQSKKEERKKSEKKSK